MNQSISKQLEARAAAAPESCPFRELAYREAGSIPVHLYWNPRVNEVLVHVRDDWNGDDFVPQAA
jgi:hypothetical protein